MPNPKRRHSKARTRTRRAHDFLTAKSLSTCPQCHEAKMPHRVCPKCGYYKGREVIAVKGALYGGLERRRATPAPPLGGSRAPPAALVMNGANFTAAGCRIALDAMGGDHAPDEVIKGALLAAAESPAHIILVGQEAVVRAKLRELSPSLPSNIEVVDAPEVVTMEDNALAPLRKKRNSSIRICANLVGEGRADAMVSAGHTGASMTSAYKVLGTIDGVSRPALAAIVPSVKGHTVLLDVGANVDTKSAHLREFAVMGHFYAQMVFGIEAPRVGLLSIGEEEGKGNELTRETFRVLEETGLNFIGNVEGRDIYNGNADVVVCDGFTGNVVLKASESLGEFVSKTLRRELTRTPLRKIGALLVKGAFDDMKKRMDYSEYGGAPLLGVNGGCIVCHGRSNAKAIKNAIRVAREFALGRIDQKIRQCVADLHTRERGSVLQTSPTAD